MSTLPERIIARKQPCPKSCAATVVAMILDCDVKDVPLRIPASNDERDKVLLDNGYEVIPLDRLSLPTGDVSILCVPSANNRGGMHSVLLDLRDYGTDIGQRFFDPNNGRDGVDFYTDDEFFSGKVSWGFVTIVRSLSARGAGDE